MCVVEPGDGGRVGWCWVGGGRWVMVLRRQGSERPQADLRRGWHAMILADKNAGNQIKTSILTMPTSLKKYVLWKLRAVKNHRRFYCSRCWGYDHLCYCKSKAMSMPSPASGRIDVYIRVGGEWCVWGNFSGMRVRVSHEPSYPPGCVAVRSTLSWNAFESQQRYKYWHRLLLMIDNINVVHLIHLILFLFRYFVGHHIEIMFHFTLECNSTVLLLLWI